MVVKSFKVQVQGYSPEKKIHSKLTHSCAKPNRFRLMEIIVSNYEMV
jgi:hypothetical protein